MVSLFCHEIDTSFFHSFWSWREKMSFQCPRGFFCENFLRKSEGRVCECLSAHLRHIYWQFAFNGRLNLAEWRHRWQKSISRREPIKFFVSSFDLLAHRLPRPSPPSPIATLAHPLPRSSPPTPIDSFSPFDLFSLRPSQTSTLSLSNLSASSNEA